MMMLFQKVIKNQNEKLYITTRIKRETIKKEDSYVIQAQAMINGC